MSSDYKAVTAFVQKEIIDAELKINKLEITKSAISGIIRKFELLGWSPHKDPGTAPNSPRFTIHSPDGKQSLKMVGGKVFRHPNFTEVICRRKHLTKRMLDLDKVPVPTGGDFLPDEKQIAQAFFEKMPKPVVIKPTDSGGSAGVTVGVSNLSEFERAWSHALAEGRKKSNVLIEQFVKGVELRAFVVGEEVVSVIARVQPYVVGTGSCTIASLLEKDREARKVNYRTLKLPVVVDWKFMRNKGLSENSIPRSGEIVFLNSLSIPQVGALIVDVTQAVSPSVKDLAVRAKNVIPELEIAGVDILVEDLKDSSSAHLLEINTSAALDLHRYPTHGRPREVIEDIVKYFHLQYSAGAR